MKKINNNNPHNRHSKDSNTINQIQIFYNYLKDNVATATMATNATGVSQKNICRYKRMLEKTGRLWQVFKKPCESTNRFAWFLTTNPNKAPKHSIKPGQPHLKIKEFFSECCV